METTTTPGLTEARDAVEHQITRTDNKAAVLLGSFGLPLAVLVAVVPGRDLNPAAAILTALGTTGLIAALLVVLAVVRPRLDGSPRGSYLHWANCTPDEVLDDITVDRRAERIVKLSQIALRKYRALRLAVDVTAAALLLLLAGVLVSLA